MIITAYALAVNEKMSLSQLHLKVVIILENRKTTVMLIKSQIICSIDSSFRTI